MTHRTTKPETVTYKSRLQKMWVEENTFQIQNEKIGSSTGCKYLEATFMPSYPGKGKS